MNEWVSLIISLPTENATVRMRAWRTLKTAGAAVLRDGVYLLPARDACRATVAAVADEVISAGGTAYVLEVAQPQDVDFTALFDRRDDHAAVLAEIAKVRDALTPQTAQELLKQVRKLRKALAGVAEIDFFPAEAGRQAEAALRALELAVARALSPHEPQPIQAAVARLRPEDYRGKTWATRHRPWVDRLASAWLIRRWVDAQARILWLGSPADCPPGALGFDFDGAAFTHVEGRCTFEVLLASFGLEQPALQRLGALVHYLDLGGVQPAEAVGIESTLAGLRDAVPDDDRLLAAASTLFDGLYAHFEKGPSP